MHSVGAARRLLLLRTTTTAAAAATSRPLGRVAASSLSRPVWLGGGLARGFRGGLAARLAEVVMNVPSMGDSITEGTVREWKKQPGEAVAVDEVVAVIETDKVSVDIRAKDAGVLVEQYAKVDDTVEVGAKLLKIDTAGSPTATGAAPAAAAAAPATSAAPAPPQPQAAAAAAAPPAGPGHGARKPLIKFLGKRSLLPKDAGHAPAAPAVGSSASAPAPVRYEDIKGTPGAKTFTEIPPMYGRPPLSAREVAAIESGGADM